MENKTKLILINSSLVGCMLYAILGAFILMSYHAPLLFKGQLVWSMLIHTPVLIFGVWFLHMITKEGNE